MRKGYLTIALGYANKGTVVLAVQICILSLFNKLTSSFSTSIK